MAERPYHKYVFDTKKRRFVGKFEDMYANEESGHYDSWGQSDLTHLGKQLSAMILGRRKYKSILDIGCGKGAFTRLLKERGNTCTATDISPTAVKKARSLCKGINFRVKTADEALKTGKRYNLIVMMEVLSYLKNWKEILKTASKRTDYLYISLYIPQNPIGFVKSIDSLVKEIRKHFDIETEFIWNRETVFVLAKAKNGK